MVTLNKGKVAGNQQGFIEGMLTGRHPDVYVQLVVNKDGVGRVMESAVSLVKKNTEVPEWNETFFLYVRELDRAAITFTVGAMRGTTENGHHSTA